MAVSALAVACAGRSGNRTTLPTRTQRPPTVAPLPALRWVEGPALPAPRSNNPVAGVSIGEHRVLFTMMGLGPGKTRTDIVLDAWRIRVGRPRWEPSKEVPGTQGRLAATAAVLDGRVYLVGGYTVAADGTEVSVPNVDVFDPMAESWSSAAAMPVPVDDTVSAVWRNRLILISGWHDRDNVADVQAFDPVANRWSALPPIVGPPVFGHAGGVVGDALLYCDGVIVDRDLDVPFQATQGCYAMTLSESSEPMAWRQLEHHGHPARYRVATGRLDTRGWLVFAGGTDHPYNYNGVGYDGTPAHPRSEVFAWDGIDQRWIDLPALPEPSMDHRGLVTVDDSLWLIGGMTDGGVVQPHVWILTAAAG